MGFSPRNILAVLSLVTAAAQAVPDVEPVLVEGGCAAFPSHDPDASFPAEFLLQADHCTNSTTGEPCRIEGFGSGAHYRIIAGETGIRQGYITIVDRNDEAKSVLRCNDATGAVEVWSATGVSGTTWNQVNISSIPYSAPLMWGLPAAGSIPLEAYHHVVDGETQDGLYMGSHGVTTWGIKRYTDRYPYWFFRLLGPGSENPVTGERLGEDEHETFIKVLPV